MLDMFANKFANIGCWVIDGTADQSTWDILVVDLG